MVEKMFFDIHIGDTSDGERWILVGDDDST